MLYLNLIWLQNIPSLREVYNICRAGILFGKQFPKIGPVHVTCTPVIWLDDSAATALAMNTMTKTLLKFIQLPHAADNPELFSLIQSYVTSKIPFEFRNNLRWLEVRSVLESDSSECSYLPCFIYEEVRHIFGKEYENICLKIESNLEKPDRTSIPQKFSYAPLFPYPMVQLASCYLKILILNFFVGIYIDTGDALENLVKLPNIHEIRYPNTLTTGVRKVGNIPISKTIGGHEDWLIFVSLNQNYISVFLNSLNSSKEFHKLYISHTDRSSEIEWWQDFSAKINKIKQIIKRELENSIRAKKIERLMRQENISTQWREWCLKYHVPIVGLVEILNQIMSVNFYSKFIKLTQDSIAKPHSLNHPSRQFIENFRYFEECFGSLPVHQTQFSFSSPGLGYLQYFQWLLEKSQNLSIYTSFFQSAIKQELYNKFNY